jgi:uncharacterized phage protein (TIGR01671 family)
MKEIKFRAWNTIDKTMYEIGSLDCPWPYDEIKIMQYTGLKDRNYRGIWEGDIVSWYHNGIKQTVNGQIVWEDISASYRYYTKLPIGGAIIRDLGYYLNKEPVDINIQVIGNIYENPELLAKETGKTRPTP